MGDRVVVYGHGPGPSCGIDFREGERYLVYASRGGRSEDSPLNTSICSGTKLLAAAEEDLSVLGPAEGTSPPETSKTGETTQASGGEDKARELPRTGGGSALIALGAAVLLAAGGVIVARRRA